MVDSRKILVLMTGGTIAQAGDDNGRMRFVKTVDDLVGAIRTEHRIDCHSFDPCMDVNLTSQAAKAIVAKVQEQADNYDGFVLITGTDAMEELAYLLDLTLSIRPPVVLTGAMKPADIVGYDGAANLEQAVAVAGDAAAADRGVLVAINDDVHLARYVRKADSQLIGAFVSHPGPVGQFRRGGVTFYYDGKRNPRAYDVQGVDRLETAVPILFYGFDMPFPRGILKDARGLVIAGMGTSSIPDAWIDYLSSEWTSQIPIVLVSRAMKGTNFDDRSYRGSLAKYEEKGFLLADFVDLNPMQARLKLCLELSGAVRLRG